MNIQDWDRPRILMSWAMDIAETCLLLNSAPPGIFKRIEFFSGLCCHIERAYMFLLQHPIITSI
jgi:hypothetical protein